MGGGGKGGGGTVNIPNPPKVDKAYGQGVDVYLKHLDELLGREQSSRERYDPQRIQEQQDLQNRFGPEQYREQLSALNQLDPTFIRNHTQLGDTVARDLQRGTALSPSSSNEIQQEVRGAQAARGNTYGDAPAIAEAYTQGDRGQQLYQQRLQNAAGYIGLPSIPQAISQINPVAPDRNSAYADPNAGWQGLNAANARYQAVAAAKAGQAGGGGGGWLSGALSGAASGASTGITFGPYGAAIGAVAGGILGGVQGSDRRLKTSIVKTGDKTPSGHNIYEFAYKNKFRGVMAQDVEKTMPSAVVTDPASGYKLVDYDQIGMPMEIVR